MGEFIGFANDLLLSLKQFPIHSLSGISPDDISDIVSNTVGNRFGAINCYPGIPGYGCCQMAFFVSLTSKSFIGNKRGHLDFFSAIEKIVQHMQGSCKGETYTAILFTDSWNSSAVDKWRDNLRQIAKDAHIEMYYTNGDTITEMPI